MRSRTRFPALVVLVATLALSACGPGDSAVQAQRRADPAVLVAAAIVALERSGEHRITPEQARQLLPLFEALRDTRPEERDATEAIARQIREVLTPQQQTALRRMREEAGGARRRMGRPTDGRGQPDPGRRAEARRAALDRAIRILEDRAR
ncbi:MAG: hypothetical protein QN163_00145 [Armatimonadota bacterium]|nr:hypothetical protein [Armatimonadota bacterium]MDR5696805.1 hypothetical protein [Armatimonadota bacterium]